MDTRTALRAKIALQERAKKFTIRRAELDRKALVLECVIDGRFSEYRQILPKMHGAEDGVVLEDANGVNHYLVKESINRCTNEMIEQYNDVKFRLSLETTSEEDKASLLKRKELLENGIENFFKIDRISRIHFHQSSLNDNTMERYILVLRPNRIGCLSETEEKRIIELGIARRQREGAVIKKINFASLANRRLAIPRVIKRPVVRPTFAAKQIKASRSIF